MNRFIEDITFFYRKRNIYGILVGYLFFPVIFTLCFLSMVWAGLIPLTLKQSFQYFLYSLLLIMVPHLLYSIWNAEWEKVKIKAYKEGIDKVDFIKAIKSYAKIMIQESEIKEVSIFMYQLLSIISVLWNVLFNSETNVLRMSFIAFIPLIAWLSFNIFFSLIYFIRLSYTMNMDLREYSNYLVESGRIKDKSLIEFIENYDMLSEQKKLKGSIIAEQISLPAVSRI